MKVIANVTADWVDLQLQTVAILRECGCKADSDIPIQTVRGIVNVDVYAEDSYTPPTKYICECKHWKRHVPKSVVHSFRTVVADSGVNIGFLISSAGFQEGAYEAARGSNVQLMNWVQFQSIFMQRWVQTFMAPQIYRDLKTLKTSALPFNNLQFYKGKTLNRAELTEFSRLRNKYYCLTAFSLHFWTLVKANQIEQAIPELPIKDTVPVRYEKVLAKGQLPLGVCEATTLKSLLEQIVKYMKEGAAEFDQLFGEHS